MSDDRQWYRHFWRCRSCGDRFHTDRLTADASKMNPRCPKRSCGGKAKQSFQADAGLDVGGGKAPGLIGDNVQNRAYDAAMNITMQDQGYTDLSDHSRPGSVYRPGESTAPKLPAHLQSQADNFWGKSQAAEKPKMRTMKADLSPIFGERATAAAKSGAIRAESSALVEPILKHKPTGSSAVPDYTPIN